MGELIKQYGPALSAIGAAIAFIWSVVQFLLVRGREARNREYQTFHELVKMLVAGSSAGASTAFIDQQAAALYELRHYPRYFPFLLRTITGLQLEWGTRVHARLQEELDLTVEYLEKYEGRIYRRLRRKLLG